MTDHEQIGWVAWPALPTFNRQKERVSASRPGGSDVARPHETEQDRRRSSHRPRAVQLCFSRRWLCRPAGLCSTTTKKRDCHVARPSEPAAPPPRRFISPNSGHTAPDCTQTGLRDGLTPIASSNRILAPRSTSTWECWPSLTVAKPISTSRRQGRAPGPAAIGPSALVFVCIAPIRPLNWPTAIAVERASATSRLTASKSSHAVSDGNSRLSRAKASAISRMFQESKV